MVISSFLVFLVSILIYGGLLLYKNSLSNEIKTLADSLERAKAAFEPSLIKELKNLSDKISASQKLLEKHISSAAVFDFLEKNTLKKVRLRSLKYSASEKEGVIVLIEGTTDGYKTLAQQGDVFEKDKNVKSISFSGLNLGEKGLVNFSAKLSLGPSFIIYKVEE